MAQRVLITGITGFAGSHLADHLLSLGHIVSGLVQPGASLDNVAHLIGRISLLEGDLLDAGRIAEILDAERPHRVFHLAAQSYVPSSWEDPVATFGVNVTGGIRLLQSCLPFRERLRLVVVTSAEIYGGGPPDGLLTEESPFLPRNPYAVSKLALDLVVGQFGKAKGLPIVRLRPSNHIGPRQSPRFVISRFAKEAAEIEAGLREPLIRVGDLEIARDFTDVRDVVRAYALVAERGKPGEGYLVCSGIPRRVGDGLDLLLGMLQVPVRVERDPSIGRAADSSHQRFSYARLEADAGWRPEISFDQTLRDTLAYWRGKVQAGS
ncbi:MAG: GDP-mannose 4,6-dehydratase [Candidatus Tectomicrobia bacterium]|uniref:GDP-mannose 4,6-dehydratase n=1 Tax=Tectimicrobiota bacterium TaxID=2528274 RepID=A0A932MKX8_UNCTE|nr:GDP-mannose 4,6-dehydratase [Candidatus Tectomicrobia bacterium]